MCKQQGARVASRSHLDFHHKQAFSSICEKRSQSSRLYPSVSRHCKLLSVAVSEVLLPSLSSLPSACVAQHLSDVVLIHYIGCISQAAQSGTPSLRARQNERETCTERERERARHFLCSLPTLILFIHRMCFSLCNPPLISSHLSLCSQFCRFSKVTSENFSPSLSLTFCSSCTHGRRREVEGVPVWLSSRSKNLLWVKMSFFQKYY